VIVQKFGGTSVGSSKLIDQVIDIAVARLERGLVLVASAMGKTTDALVRMGQLAADGRAEQARDELKELRSRHYGSLVDLLEVPLYEEGKRTVDGLFAELESLLTGLILIQEVSRRSLDTLLSFGERLSTALIYYRARQRGINAVLLDSRSFIKTDSTYGRAAIDLESTDAAIRDQIPAEPGTLYVAQGFIGSDAQNVTTTLGRGGSDYTATIIGAALDAEEVQIWTDVTGIMTSDPRLIGNARTIDELSYAEAAELSYFGAKVIHPSTIQPAVEKHIPVWVKNTTQPEQPGSRIHGEGRRRGIQAIAGKKGVTLVNVHSSRMLNAYGFLKRIFEVFEKYRISVDLIATSEVSVSLTIEDASTIDSVRSELEQFSTVTVESGKAIISLVGQDLWKQSKFTARVFAAMSDIPVRMISLGSSDINLSLVVPEDRLDGAIRSLHAALFEDDSVTA
jgi:aspartate kinase